MKKNFFSLFTFVVMTFGMVACNNGQKQQAAKENIESEAAAAGQISKDLLNEELKMEVKTFMKDLPTHNLPEQISSGKVKVSVTNTDYMLPLNRVEEFETITQKARAFGFYGTDVSVLKAMDKPYADLEKVMIKLAVDLNIPFDKDDKEIKGREKYFDAMIDNNKTDVMLEILGSICVEYALVYADPSFEIQADVTDALSKNMQKRLEMILEITNDLASYYPDLQFMGKTIKPLKEMLTPIDKARESRAEIVAMREALLK